MRFRDKLMKEHPDAVHIVFVGGCKTCPDIYGYEKEKPSFCWITADYVSDPNQVCTKCWDREIPGEDEHHE